MKIVPVIDVVSKRWSPYSFSSRPIEKEFIKSLFEAARLAPSSMNEQPWSFVYAIRDDKEHFEAFSGFLFEGNRIWAVNAYILAVVMARTKYSRNDSPNRHAFYDTGMAVANLLAQATSLGLYVHQMGGFSVEAVKKHFGMDDSSEPVAMMAIGWPGDGAELNDDLRKRDSARRPRKPLQDFVFRNFPGLPAF